MAKLKEFFLLLYWDPIVKFPEAGVKVKISISAETAPLLGNSRASSPSRFNRGAEKLQQIRSNRGPRLLPTISFVENNSPVKARLVGGKLLDPQLLNPARPGGSTRDPVDTVAGPVRV